MTCQPEVKFGNSLFYYSFSTFSLRSPYSLSSSQISYSQGSEDAYPVLVLPRFTPSRLTAMPFPSAILLGQFYGVVSLLGFRLPEDWHSCQLSPVTITWNTGWKKAEILFSMSMEKITHLVNLVVVIIISNKVKFRTDNNLLSLDATHCL